MKDAARLVAYFAATLIAGALLAPWLFWLAQIVARHGWPQLATFDFETFFHRALLIAGVVLLPVLLRASRIRRFADMGLEPNRRWLRDAVAGALLAAIPLLLFGALLLVMHGYELRRHVNFGALPALFAATIAVPLIEETFFRGVVLGILLRGTNAIAASAMSAALFSILHFLKATEGTNVHPRWYSGFVSIAHAFAQFREPVLLLGGFATLFILGCILAHARIVTRSLWLAIGLHAGWIFANGIFNRFARRSLIGLPWIGPNLTVGVLPLVVALITWVCVLLWIRHARPRAS